MRNRINGVKLASDEWMIERIFIKKAFMNHLASTFKVDGCMDINSMLECVKKKDYSPNEFLGLRTL